MAAILGGILAFKIPDTSTNEKPEFPGGDWGIRIFKSFQYFKTFNVFLTSRIACRVPASALSAELLTLELTTQASMFLLITLSEIGMDTKLRKVLFTEKHQVLVYDLRSECQNCLVSNGS